MEKIVIIGSPGAGKTWLARELCPILKIKKVIHLDRLFWKRGWKRETGDIRIDIMQALVQEKRWIIEGTYLCSSGPRLEAADTIIFLDISSVLCLWRIWKRHREYRGRSRRDLPEGCTDKLTFLRMLKVLAFPLRGRRRLEEKLRKYNSKQIIRLRSRKAVKEFLAKLVQDTDDKRGSSPTAQTAKDNEVLHNNPESDLAAKGR